MSLGLSGAGFRLSEFGRTTVAVTATKSHRLKPAPLRLANHTRQIVC